MTHVDMLKSDEADMAKITVTVEDDTKSPEELTAIATKAIQEALNTKSDIPKPGPNNYCNCGDKADIVWMQFGGGDCRRCGGYTY